MLQYTRRGWRATVASGSRPRPSRASGRRLLMKTSAVASSSSRCSRPSGSAQVEDDAALAPVVEREGRVRHVVVDAQRAEDLAHRVAGRRLDLDDVGAPVGQQRRGRRGGHPDAQLDDPQVGEGREPRRRVGAHRPTPERTGHDPLAEKVLHHLAGGVERQLVDELDRPGDLVVGHLVAAPVDDRRRSTPPVTGARRRPCRPRRGARRGCRSPRPARCRGGAGGRSRSRPGRR